MTTKPNSNTEPANTLTPSGPVDQLDRLGAQWSPDFDAYAAGRLSASAVRCVLCRTAPCSCSRCSGCDRDPQCCRC